MSHSFSKKWVSDQIRENETYKRVSGHFRHIAPKSPVLPTSFKDWLAHQHAMVEQNKANKQQKMQQRIDELGLRKREGKRSEPKPAFNVAKFNDGGSSVLAMRTIWLPRDIEPAKPHTPWPSDDELKHCGDYRASSEQHRAVPHPRIYTGPSVKWENRPLVALSPFDDPSLNEGKDDMAEITDAAEYLGLGLLKELDN